MVSRERYHWLEIYAFATASSSAHGGPQMGKHARMATTGNATDAFDAVILLDDFVDIAKIDVNEVGRPMNCI